MGKIEQKVRKRARRKNLQYAILATIGIGGLMAMAIVAPNAIQALAKLGIINLKKKNFPLTVVNRSRNQLLKAGLLAHNKNGYLYLTPKGESKLRQLELRHYQLPKPRRW